MVFFHFHSIFNRAFCKKNKYANDGDPDQMPRSAASDLGLPCLSMFAYVPQKGRYAYIGNWNDLVHTSCVHRVNKLSCIKNPGRILLGQVMRF